MLKVWIACALLALAGGAAFYATDGKLWGLPQSVMTSVSKPTAPQSSDKPADGKKGAGDAKGSPSAAQRSVAVEAAAAVAATSTQDLRGIGTLQSDESVQISS